MRVPRNAAAEYWRPERQPGRRACAECKANPDRQVLNGHGDCLPPIGGRFTADNVPVVQDLRVWDYDLRPGTVIEVDHSFQGTPDSVGGIIAWHLVRADDGRTGMFDGSRMCTRNPFDGASPPPPPVDEHEPEAGDTYDFFVELRPPGSSDAVPSVYLHSRGPTLEESLVGVRVPDGWAVFMKRRRLIEYRTCRTCGTDEEVINRSRKQEFGMVAFLECGHFQNDDEY